MQLPEILSFGNALKFAAYHTSYLATNAFATTTSCLLLYTNHYIQGKIMNLILIPILFSN